MRPKLISLNFGVTLTVMDGDRERKIRFSGNCPSPSFPSVMAALDSILEAINDEFGTHYFLDSGSYKDKIAIVKPRKADSVSRIDQEQFVRELMGHETI